MLGKDDVDHVLIELHDVPTCINFDEEMTKHKLLREGYYWPTLFKDAHAYAQKCQIFQVNAGRERRSGFPLQLVMVQNPFEQRGLDVVSEINPNSSKLHKYILTSTNYFTRWTKAIALKSLNDNEVIQFLQ